MSSALGVFLMVFAPLAAFAQAASPPPDWIDEFPSVTEVAHAAFEEMKVTAARRNLDNTGDDDAVAINLAGTFVVLRQIMFLKYNEEPPMATDREEKLKKLVASYEEAELTIGRGWAGRSGYIERAAPTGLGRVVLPTLVPVALERQLWPREYRRRVLNRLFPCGALAKELDELRQKHATTVPYMPSPAATVRIDPALAGIGPSGCSAYGGDSRRAVYAMGGCRRPRDKSRLRPRLLRPRRPPVQRRRVHRRAARFARARQVPDHRPHAGAYGEERRAAGLDRADERERGRCRHFSRPALHRPRRPTHRPRYGSSRQP